MTEGLDGQSPPEPSHATQGRHQCSSGIAAAGVPAQQRRTPTRPHTPGSDAACQAPYSHPLSSMVVDDTPPGSVSGSELPADPSKHSRLDHDAGHGSISDIAVAEIARGSVGPGGGPELRVQPAHLSGHARQDAQASKKSVWLPLVLTGMPAQTVTGGSHGTHPETAAASAPKARLLDSKLGAGRQIALPVAGAALLMPPSQEGDGMDSCVPDAPGPAEEPASGSGRSPCGEQSPGVGRSLKGAGARQHQTPFRPPRRSDNSPAHHQELSRQPTRSHRTSAITIPLALSSRHQAQEQVVSHRHPAEEAHVARASLTGKASEDRPPQGVSKGVAGKARELPPAPQEAAGNEDGHKHHWTDRHPPQRTSRHSRRVQRQVTQPASDSASPAESQDADQSFQDRPVADGAERAKPAGHAAWDDLEDAGRMHTSSQGQHGCGEARTAPAGVARRVTRIIERPASSAQSMVHAGKGTHARQGPASRGRSETSSERASSPFEAGLSVSAAAKRRKSERQRLPDESKPWWVV